MQTMTNYNLEENATPAYAAPLRKGGSNLRPESVISFLTRNESGNGFYGLNELNE